jgi:hypothetical protein
MNMQTAVTASKPLLLVCVVVTLFLVACHWLIWSSTSADSQFWLARWLPLLATGVTLARWPWQRRWQFHLDGIGTWLIILGLIAALGTLLYAEPILISLATISVGWAFSRGLYVGNTRPLSGMWFPLLLPLFLVAGFDVTLNRWHDQANTSFTQLMLDAIAVPNNGLVMLPAQNDSYIYDLFPSGCAILGWGSWVATALIVAAANGRRLFPTIFLTISAFLLGIGSSLLVNIVPAYTDRFLGDPWHLFPAPDAPAPPAYYYLLIVFVMTLVLLSADQFWRFMFSKVEPDPESTPMVLWISRVWNRLMSNELSSRRMRIVNSQAIDNPVALGLLVAIGLLVGLFTVRLMSVADTGVSASGNSITQAAWTPTAPSATSTRWLDVPRFLGSRLGDRSWIWQISIQEREVLFRLDFSPSLQIDPTSEMQLLRWIAVEPQSDVEPLVWNWKRLTPQQARTAIQPLPTKPASTDADKAQPAWKLTRDQIGHFPTWQGTCLLDPRLDGVLSRKPWMARYYTEHQGDLPAEFATEVELQFNEFIAAMSRAIQNPTETP